MRGRSTETEDKITQRLAKAREEISFSDQFDSILINDTLDTACVEAEILVKNFLHTE